jgi:hypothetical protein
MSPSTLTLTAGRRVSVSDGTHSPYLATLSSNLFEAEPVDLYMRHLDALRTEHPDGLAPADHPTLRTLALLRIQIRRARAWSALLGQIDLTEHARRDARGDGDEASRQQWRLHLLAEAAARASCARGVSATPDVRCPAGAA